MDWDAGSALPTPGVVILGKHRACSRGQRRSSADHLQTKCPEDGRSQRRRSREPNEVRFYATVFDRLWEQGEPL